MLLFPAWMVHQVFPFYGTEKDRITVSGNIWQARGKELDNPLARRVISSRVGTSKTVLTIGKRGEKKEKE